MLASFSCVSWVQVFASGGAAENFDCFRQAGSLAAESGKAARLPACFFSVILIETGDVNNGADNGNRDRDFFPSTHWRVVLAAGGRHAGPETPGPALPSLS